MHDIDRTQLEMGWETDALGSGEFEFEEPFLETSDEMYEEPYGEFEGEADSESPLDEADEMELAAELLETADEAELDQFLGGLFKKVSRAVGRALPPAVRNQLGGVLKGLAKKYLPVAGAAFGNMIAPGIGGALGGQLASLAGQRFGLELEGLSPEDQEFEVARRYVRLAGEAVRQAASAPVGIQPQAIVQRAIATAAQTHAPGLVNRVHTGRLPARGTWHRRGKAIVLDGFFR